jgi:hypothetical protein
MIDVVKDKIKVTVALQNNREEEIKAQLEAEESTNA